MLTRTQIQRLERESNDYTRQIHETFQHRSEGEARFKAWENACDAWHGWENPCFYMWSLESRDRMRRGEREVIEDALLFLEVDPWFHRSGYLKERILRHFKSLALPETDRARLREVTRSVTQRRNRREFFDYCRLALRVWTPEWEAQLRAEAPTRNEASLGKYRYLLDFLDRHRDQLKT